MKHVDGQAVPLLYAFIFYLVLYTQKKKEKEIAL